MKTIRIFCALLLGGALGYVAHADDYHHPPTEGEVSAICYGGAFTKADRETVMPPPLSSLSEKSRSICDFYKAAAEEKGRQKDERRRQEADRALAKSIAAYNQALLESEGPK